MSVRFLDLYAQYQSIKPEMDAAIAAVIRDSAFIGGKNVAAFEEAFSNYQQAKYCVGVGNGTDAIEIALEALDLPPGSEVLVPANSFIATAEAVTRAGYRVLFCDCNPATYTLSIEDAQRRITPNTRAIIPVHLYGQPCDMEGVLALAARYGLRVIEDCAQAHGAEWQGRRVGALGDLGTFSFYPGKNLGAYGDAGAIVTNDPALAKRCRMIANHGRIGKYDHEFEGRNSRLDGLQAAILNVKLNHLESWVTRRIAVAARYNEILANLPEIILPVTSEFVRHVWHLFVVRTARRDELKTSLAEKGIETGIHYPIALPKLAAYAYLGQFNEEFEANRLDGELLSLPMGEHLAEVEILKVFNALSAAVKG